MLAKVVALFLVVIAVLGMFGRLRYPGQKQIDARRCKGCGKFRLGRGTCDCGHKKG